MTILRVGAERDEENGLKKHPHSGHRHRPYFRRARPFPPARLQRLPVFLEEWSARVAGESGRRETGWRPPCAACRL
jgi:hypothetical protein